MTAIHVGQELAFGPSGSSRVSSRCTENSIVWSDQDGVEKDKTTSPEEIKELALKHTLCITGDALDELASKMLDKILVAKTLQYVQVFARTSPNQKDFIVGKLNALGLTTLMCGDGTNDVGSLKRSHCGVAVINK